VERHQWGEVPPPSYGSTVVKALDRWVLLFGGKLHAGGTVNTTHLLDLTTFEWRLLRPRGSLFAEAFGHPNATILQARLLLNAMSIVLPFLA
jgi:hypothetical protein